MFMYKRERERERERYLSVNTPTDSALHIVMMHANRLNTHINHINLSHHV